MPPVSLFGKYKHEFKRFNSTTEHIINNSTPTGEYHHITDALHRFDKYLRYCYSDSVYKLSIYQRSLMREANRISIAFICGRTLWLTHGHIVLSYFNIDSLDEILLSTTGRRFGKTVTMSKECTASILTVRSHDYPSKSLDLPVISTCREASKRDIKQIKGVMQKFPDTDELFFTEYCSEKIVLINKMDSLDVRQTMALAGHGVVSIFLLFFVVLFPFFFVNFCNRTFYRRLPPQYTHIQPPKTGMYISVTDFCYVLNKLTISIFTFYPVLCIAYFYRYLFCMCSVSQKLHIQK